MSNSSAVAYLEGKKTQTNQPTKQKTMKKIFFIWISRHRWPHAEEHGGRMMRGVCGKEGKRHACSLCSTKVTLCSNED